MLSVGMKAPEFTLPDQNGVVHTLSEYKGKRFILYFYPKDNTSGCSLQACGYSDNINIFRNLGIEVVGVSKDSVASHKKFEEKYGLKFTLLSNETLETMIAYDVWKEKSLYGRKFMGAVRTTYLIDEKGTIIFACDKVKAREDAVKMLKEVE